MCLSEYAETLKSVLDNCVLTTNQLEKFPLMEGLKEIIETMIDIKRKSRKIMLIGNGGSASIASHMAVDFMKRGGIKAMTFNDPSLLTCMSNDFCYEMVFSKPLEQFAEKGDLLFAISSSGNSANIVNGAKMARDLDCKVVTFSGFTEENSLRKLGDYNFFLSNGEYGIVEMGHHVILHYLIDEILAGQLSPIIDSVEQKLVFS